MPRMMLVLLSLISIVALAQPDPGNQPGGQPVKPNPLQPIAQPMMPSPNSVAMEVTPEGLFVAAGGIVTKYDGRTLNPLGKAELLPPLVRPLVDPQNNQPNMDMVRYNYEAQKRNMPPGLLPAGPSLIVLFNDQLFVVNQRTMDIDTKVDMADPRMIGNFYGPAPIMKTNGDMLYIIRFPYIASIDLKAGKVLGKATVPGVNLLQPIAMPINAPVGVPNQPLGQPTTEAAPIVVVGTLKFVNLEGGFWVVKDEQNAEFVLQGDKLREMIANQKLDGRRVRIQGTLKPGPGIAQYGKGTLTVQRFELLQ